MASYSRTHLGCGSITVRIRGLSSRYENYVRFLIRYDDSETTIVFDESFDWEDSSSCYVAVYGLEPGRDYAMNAKGYYYDDDGEIHGSEDWIGTKYFSTPDYSPDYFHWTSTISSEAKFNISRTEWNNFADTLYDELRYVGYEHDYSKSDLRVARGDYLTADLWNIFAELFRDGLKMRELPYVDEGDYVYADYFLDAEDAINRCIDTYGPDQFWEDEDADMEFWI